MRVMGCEPRDCRRKGGTSRGKVRFTLSCGHAGDVLYREALPPRAHVNMRLIRGPLTERVNAHDSAPSILFRATDATVPGVEAVL